MVPDSDPSLKKLSNRWYGAFDYGLILREEPISQSKAGSLPPFLLSAFRVLELLTGSEAQFIIVKARAWQFPAGAESSTSSSEG